MDLRSLLCLLLTINIAKDIQWDTSGKERLAEKTPSLSSPSPSTLSSEVDNNQEYAIQDSLPTKRANVQLTSEEPPSQPTKVQSRNQLESPTTVPSDQGSKPTFASKSAKQSKQDRDLKSKSPAVANKGSATNTYKQPRGESHPNPSEGQKTLSTKQSEQDSNTVSNLAFHKSSIDHSDLFLTPLNVEYHSRKSETLFVYPSVEDSTFAKQSKAKTKVPPIEPSSSSALPARPGRRLYVTPFASTESSTYKQNKSLLNADPPATQEITADNSPTTAYSFAQNPKESSTISLVIVPANTTSTTAEDGKNEQIISLLVATIAIQTPPRRRVVPSYK